MEINEVRLNPQLRQEHHRVLLHYLVDELTLSSSDWSTLVEAVGLLDDSVTVIGRQEQTFRQFYSTHIDRKFADSFLARLFTLEALEVEGSRLQAKVARKICRLLDEIEGINRDDNDCRILLVNCLYWWAAFSRGYLFELAICRDLSASGIRFRAHDIANRNERFSPYDLLVEGFRGDIKYTTYFLTTARLTQLNSYFFITRWYHTRRREWLRVVIFRERMRERLFADVAATQKTLEELSLNSPAAFTIDNITLTALECEQWKQHILQIQSAQGG